jgi:histidinol-phosphate aminotransferase
MSVKNLIRPNILALDPYHSAREKVLEGVLLDANENPYRQEVAGIGLNRYPDPFQRRLRQAAAKVFGVPPTCIAAGTGSDEVLEWIFKVFCQPAKDAVLTAEPTYGMYQVTARIFGVDWRPFPLGPGFGFDAASFLASVPYSAKVLFLCSPNNPTGNVLDREQIRKVLQNWSKIVVVDEAYIDFAEDASLVPFLDEHPNLIIMRTLSKAYGRAALRLGFAIASREIISYFLKVKTPYNLNALTMEFGCQALADTETKRRNVESLRAERDLLMESLRRAPGVEQVYPSDANFVLFRCPGAKQLVEKLFEKGIIVRDRSTVPGLPNCIRVSVGTAEENRLFIEELTHLLGAR